MFRTAATFDSGASGCSVYAHAPSSPRSSEFHAANSTLRFGRWPSFAASAYASAISISATAPDPLSSAPLKICVASAPL